MPNVSGIERSKPYRMRFSVKRQQKKSPNHSAPEYHTEKQHRGALHLRKTAEAVKESRLPIIGPWSDL